ncbi:MAG: 16S rRNA (adenine(1518)-N(6)/adenine(1519)-N(6))-dimethyltransferase RsmA [Bacillota bacterium]
MKNGTGTVGKNSAGTVKDCACRLGEDPPIRPRKSLGQNFLIDASYLDVIIGAAELGPEDAVLEIGAGTGALTGALSRHAAHVTAVEVDGRLVGLLRGKLGHLPNVDVVQGNILDLSLTDLMRSDTVLGKRCKVVANLPYYITSPVILKLLEEAGFLERIVVLVQKEVAERMVAAPGSKKYGAFSVVVQYHTDAEIAGIVPPEAFWPAPKVSSAIVRLDVRSVPAVNVKSEGFFFAVVRAGFRMRRKTLLRALSLAAQGAPELQGAGEEVIREALARAGIDPTRRAETLRLEEFGRLADALYDGLHL